jgi:hypothetical protein
MPRHSLSPASRVAPFRGAKGDKEDKSPPNPEADRARPPRKNRVMFPRSSVTMTGLSAAAAVADKQSQRVTQMGDEYGTITLQCALLRSFHSGFDHCRHFIDDFQEVWNSFLPYNRASAPFWRALQGSCLRFLRERLSQNLTKLMKITLNGLAKIEGRELRRGRRTPTPATTKAILFGTNPALRPLP